MTDTDTRQMIARCINEIKGLRRLVDELRPDAEAYAVLKQVLGLLPSNVRYSATPDIVQMLEKQLEELMPKVPAEEDGA